MLPSNWQEWVAWAGIVIPLMGMVWASIFYAIKRRREIHFHEYQRVFEIIDHLGQYGGSIASKVSAAYELRKYPEYKTL
ncbi:MAG: hypothetical protein HC843_02990 [Sphingomonadales bacterium]|nr:hypothetical protein [Sphingomonadales bacterium]